jgi:hypothetical protein
MPNNETHHPREQPLLCLNPTAVCVVFQSVFPLSLLCHLLTCLHEPHLFVLLITLFKTINKQKMTISHYKQSCLYWILFSWTSRPHLTQTGQLVLFIKGKLISISFCFCQTTLLYSTKKR